MTEPLVFAGGTVVTPFREMMADVVVEGARIREIRPPAPPRPGERVIDCTGKYVGPGLVDIHVHGGAGNDFVTDDADEMLRGVEYHLSQGTTGITPSCLSVPFSQARRSIAAAREAARRFAGTVLGYHVEGMYLDQTFRGGHLTDYVHNPDPAEYLPLIEADGDFITEWTLAPELPGALGVIRACREAGIVTSVGHSQATYEEMMLAIEAGLRHATHLACASGNLRNEPLRESTGQGYAPGVVETTLLRDELTTEVIVDGFHLHAGLIHLALKCKGPQGLCLVSDSMKGVGLPDGEYIIGDQRCVVEGGIALIADRPGAIASSVTPLSGMLRYAHRSYHIPLAVAWTMASSTPARVIGVDDRKGSLAAGKDADILILDRELQVAGVIAKGVIVAVTPGATLPGHA